MPPKAKEEKRVDPEDGQSYTFTELSAYYAGKYKKKDIAVYWDTCKPAKGSAKAKAKGKAKAAPEPKTKAKAKAKVKAKAKSGSTLPKKGVKLYYWPARGRGEQVRLALAVTGVSWEDVNFDMADEDSKSAFFAKCRELGGNATTNTPMLEVKGKFYTQSVAILKFVCACGGLSTDNAKTNYVIDNIIAHVEDLRSASYKPMALFGGGEKEKETYLTSMPTHVGNLERLLGDRKYFVGGKLSAADIAVFDVLDTYVELMVPGTLAKYPKLEEFVGRIKKIEAIAKYQESEQQKKLFAFPAL